MFTRSQSGIGNRALFTDAQFTIYVENDPSCDPSQAIDVAFWREFFRHYYPNIRVTFFPLGGKQQVLSMANKIVGLSIPNSFCAMDCDYQRQFTELFDDQRIFYSYGYGVENDIFNASSIISIIRAILPGAEETDAHGAAIWNLVETTVRLERLALIGDQIACARGTAVLDRAHPQSDFVHDKNLPVRFRRQKVKESITRAGKNKGEKEKNFTPNPCIELVPAHHYIVIAYQTVVRYISSFTVTKFSFRSFIAICLGCIQNYMFQFLPSALRGYYDLIGSREVLKFSNIDH